MWKALAVPSAEPTHLFCPLRVRGVELRNRVGVSPMCEYSSEDGVANEWHLVHLGSRAVGGAGLVMTEATAVTAEGRISPADLGIWKDEHVAPLRRAAEFVAAHGAVPGIQLAHAGRKASTARPWEEREPVLPERGGWTPVAPSALPFNEGWLVPRALSAAEVAQMPEAFAAAARRALAAGFRWIELHAAHGYLLHEFLSPLSNVRDDAWGGSWEGRARLTLETVQAVRAAIGDELPSRCGCRLPTGRTAPGAMRTRCGSRRCSARPVPTWSIAARAGSRTRNGFRPVLASRCRSRRRCGARAGC